MIYSVIEYMVNCIHGSLLKKFFNMGYRNNYIKD